MHLFSLALSLLFTEGGLVKHHLLGRFLHLARNAARRHLLLEVAGLERPLIDGYNLLLDRVLVGSG